MKNTKTLKSNGNAPASHRNQPKLLGFNLADNSMEPRYYKGQTAVFNPKLRPVNGDLVVANIRKTGALVREYSRRGDNITLKTNNKSHKPIKLHEKDLLEVWPVEYVSEKFRKL